MPGHEAIRDRHPVLAAAGLFALVLQANPSGPGFLQK